MLRRWVRGNSPKLLYRLACEYLLSSRVLRPQAQQLPPADWLG